MARIIIAEDQAHIRRILVMWISRHGHEVIEAATGGAAMQALRDEAVELLITDVNMPEIDGLELAEQAFDICPGLRGVFVVTSRCDQQDILDRLTDPRVRLFPKPFSPSQLVREVEAVVGQGTESRSIKGGSDV